MPLTRFHHFCIHTLRCVGIVVVMVSLLYAHGSAQTSPHMDSIIAAARKFLLSDPDKVKAILEPELHAALQSGAHADAVPILNQLAIVEVIKGTPGRGITLLKQAAEHARASGDNMLQANALTRVAKTYYDAGYPDSAMSASLDAIGHYDLTPNPGYSWACFTILGDIATNSGTLREAEDYYLKALDQAQRTDRPKDVFIVAGILQHFYKSNGNVSKYAAVLEDLLRRYPYFHEDLTETNAHYYALLQLYDPDEESIGELRKSIALFRQFNHPMSLTASMSRLGQLLSLDGKQHEAYDTLVSALNLTRYSIPTRLNLYYQIYSNRAEVSDAANALKYYILFQNLKDSVQTERALENIRDLEIQYKTKEKEVALLEEQQVTRQRTTQRNILLLLSGVAIWFGIFGVLFFWNRARLQRKLTMQAEALHEQRIQQLKQKQKLLVMSSMIEGQEAERKRIAQDLHDGLGGLLSSVKAQLSLIQQEVVRLESMDLYRRANTLVDTASSELRRIAYSMMPSSLSRLGLEAAVEDLCSALKHDHDLDVNLQIFGLQDRLQETTEIMLYRIIQELITNVIKHAEASKLLIQINNTGSELFLIVEDNGKGIDPEIATEGQGIGLRSIESRVKYLDGTLDISKGTEGGTCVTIQVPVSSELPTA